VNKPEVAQLLTLISTFDRRTVGQTDVEAWHLLLAKTAYDDAQQAALNHISTEHRWLTPADILCGVKAIRSDRASDLVGPGQPEEIPDADPDDVRGYLAAVREQRYRAGNGLSVRSVALAAIEAVGERLAITAGPVRPAANPYAVGCPYCEARPHTSCFAKGSDRRLTDVHQSRVDAAKAALS
jgi:hypothetical protein